MADRDYDKMMARYLAGREELAREEMNKAAPLISRFIELAALQGVTLDGNSFEYVDTIGIVATSPGLAKRLMGPMRVERDGLFAYDEVARSFAPNGLRSGYFMGQDFMVMAHPYYRRSMHPRSNWAPLFVDVFWGLDLPGVTKYIAIDDDRVRIDVDGSSYMELDTWYGAPFDKDVRKIKSGTSKLRPPLDIEAGHVNMFFASAHCLDIKWSGTEGIKTFQALELKKDDVRLQVDGDTYFPARYLHAEFDIAENRFRHFDGAVQLFREEEYLQRRDSDFNMPAKNLEHVKARSKKVFKLNGPVATKVWVDLCCHFFAANPLTFEYFTGKYPEHVIEALAKIRKRDIAPG